MKFLHVTDLQSLHFMYKGQFSQVEMKSASHHETKKYTI